MIANKSALLTGVKLSTACALAFILYTAFHWPYGYWSVVSVAAVTRPGLSFTLNKAMMRIVGTVIGAMLGYLIGWIATGNVIVVMCFFFMGIIVSSYVALQKSLMSYCGIIFGLTLTLVLASGLMTNQLFGMAVYRTIEVIVGIACILVVNSLLRLFFPRKEALKAPFIREFRLAWKKLLEFKNNKPLFFTAVRIAVAASLTFLPWVIFRYPGGYWATISCFFIMEESTMRVQEKGWMRFISHVIVAVIGVVIAFIVGNHLWYLLFPILIIYFALGYLMVSHSTFSTSCNTMGIALAIMLLANPGLASTLGVILSRFLNVIGGIGVGILISTYFFPSLVSTGQ